MAHDSLPYGEPGEPLPPVGNHLRRLPADGSFSGSGSGSAASDSRSRQPLSRVSRQPSRSYPRNTGSRKGSPLLRQAVRTSSRSYYFEQAADLRHGTRKATGMPYRDEDIRSSHRPLIDFIPDDSLYVEDEDEAFYAKEEDYLIHPHWKAMVTRTTNRIPRRVQRWLIIYFVLLIVTWIAWRNYYGPKYAKYRQELNEMDNTPLMAFGSNVRPEFRDLIHIATMDEKHLPAHRKRLVVVGDVHGCIDELEALLSKVEFNDKHDHLILTGDIINKGPDSAGVVSLAQKLGASCVRGNHEDKLLLSMAEARIFDEDNNPSDFAQVESKTHGNDKLHKLAKEFTKDQISWLKQCPVILRVGQVPGLGDVVAVHAGLVPGVPLEKQDPFQCMNMRTIDLKTRLPSENREGTPWEKFWNHQQKKLPVSERTTVLYGHDAKRGMNIQPYSKGLDSSCVRGGQLTALVIDAEGKEKLVQVKCKGYVQ